MIELAPNHKSGLSIDNPIILGGGVLGVAEQAPQALREAGCGAVVVGPITHSPRRGTLPPRLAQTTGGFLLDTGLQNRGVRASVRRFARTWRRLGVPVLAQIADSDVEHALRTARHLAESGAVAALELLVQAHATVDELSWLTETLALECELPLLVKLPYANATETARAVADAGASAIVVCQPPLGLQSSSDLSGVPVSAGFGDSEPVHVDPVTGSLYGASLFSLMMHRLAEVVREKLNVPLIACGGVHSWADASVALAAGATAVQVDGAAWVEPGLPRELVRAWRASSSATAG